MGEGHGCIVLRASTHTHATQHKSAGFCGTAFCASSESCQSLLGSGAAMSNIWNGWGLFRFIWHVAMLHLITAQITVSMG